MSNYDMDEIDRLNEKEKSQKQKTQWRNYVSDSLKHPLDSSEATRMPMSAPVVLEDEGFGRDDQTNIQEILRKNSKIPSKPCQQWDTQTQSYVEVIKELDKDVNLILPLVDDNTSREELDMLRRPLEKEEVTNPKHYDKVGFGIQPLEYIIANELDFLEGNVIKYVSRYPHKGGINDLLKARTYIEKLIERERIKDER